MESNPGFNNSFYRAEGDWQDYNIVLIKDYKKDTFLIAKKYLSYFVETKLKLALDRTN